MQTPGPIEYERATSVKNAIDLLEKYGPETRILAGGHSLLPMMKLRLANPERLIDINEIDDLSYIKEQDGEIRIGAMTRHRELLESELLAGRFPVFADAEKVIADPVVRNRGTIGGSLAQADAAEDLSAVCSALKASVVIAGSDGERMVSMDDFHVGPYMTAIQDARDPDRGSPSRPARRRQRPREGGAARRATGRSSRSPQRSGWTGTPSPTPAWRSAPSGPPRSTRRAPRSCCAASSPSEELFAEAGAIASEDCYPIADGRGPVDYKRHLAGELTKRALRRAAERALNQEA